MTGMALTLASVLRGFARELPDYTDQAHAAAIRSAEAGVINGRFWAR